MPLPRDSRSITIIFVAEATFNRQEITCAFHEVNRNFRGGNFRNFFCFFFFFFFFGERPGNRHDRAATLFVARSGSHENEIRGTFEEINSINEFVETEKFVSQWSPLRDRL